MAGPSVAVRAEELPIAENAAGASLVAEGDDPLRAVAGHGEVLQEAPPEEGGMGLPSCSWMDARKHTKECRLEVRYVDTSEMHVEVIGAMDPGHSLPTDDRELQLHGEGRVNATIEGACIHQGELDPLIRLEIGIKTDLNPQRRPKEHQCSGSGHPRAALEPAINGRHGLVGTAARPATSAAVHRFA